MSMLKKLSAAAVATLVGASLVAVVGAETVGIGFQTNTYTFRNHHGQSTCVFWDDTWYEENEAGEFDNGYVAEGFTVSDATVTGDGQYTVKVSGIPANNLSQTGENVGFNFIKLSSDIDPTKYPDLKITVNSVKIGDTAYDVNTTLDGVADNDVADFSIENVTADDYSDEGFATLEGTVNVNVWNMYAQDGSLLTADQSAVFGDIEVTFTVEGMVEGAPATDAPATDAPATDAPATDAPATDAPATDAPASPETGAEGIAVVAGVAVLATTAAIVAKKRK